MNLGLPELSIIGVLALFLFGGLKLKEKSKKKGLVKTSGKDQKDLMANFQNINSDYDDTPIKKSIPD